MENREDRRGYTPPSISVLGSVHALTETKQLGGPSDGVFFFLLSNAS